MKRSVSGGDNNIYFFSLIENHRRIGLRQQRNAAVYQDPQAEMMDVDLTSLWEKYLSQL